MLKLPSLIMLMGCLTLGVILAVSSTSWFGAWVGLELNLLTFVPILMLKTNSGSTEAGLKYFLIQACGSLILLQAGVLMTQLSYKFSVLIIMALILKSGGAPLYFWFPMVSNGLVWSHLMVLMTLQKLAPLTLLFYLLSAEWAWVYVISSLLSAVVGGVGGINEMFLRKLLGFSAINHFGWMLLAMLSGGLIWVIYFLIYSVIVLSLMAVLNKKQIYHINQMFVENLNKMTMLSVGAGFMSLGGLPPLLGFMPKWLVLINTIKLSSMMAAIIMVVFSVLPLFYYLRVSLVVYLSTSSSVSGGSLSFSLLEFAILGLNMVGIYVVSLVWVLD